MSGKRARAKEHARLRGVAAPFIPEDRLTESTGMEGRTTGASIAVADV